MDVDVVELTEGGCGDTIKEDISKSFKLEKDDGSITTTIKEESEELLQEDN